MSDSNALVLAEEGQHSIVSASVKDPLMFLKAAAESNVSKHQLFQIKTPSGGGTTWEFDGPDGVESGRELNVILAYIRPGQRKYYIKPYGKGDDSSPPDCYCEDGVHGLGVHKEGDAPLQRNCAQCPLNEWKTDPRGGDGKACGEFAQIFAFLPGDYLPTVINVPPTSLKGLRVFRTGRLHKGMDVNACVARLTLEKIKASADYSIIKFGFLRNLTPDEYEKATLLTDELSAMYPQRNVWDDSSEAAIVDAEVCDAEPETDWAQGESDEE